MEIMLVAAAAAFTLTFLSIPVVIRLAWKFKCYDLPGKRRFHCDPTPRGGGAGFFLGSVLPMLILLPADRVLASYCGAAALLFAVGAVDDIRSLGWKPKMAAIAAAASVAVFGGGIEIREIALGPAGVLSLGRFSAPFTLLAIVGMTNAMNLLDGLNGLAGGASLLGFLFIGLAAFSAGNSAIAVVSLIFVAALAGFLIYNFPRARIFMGDAGSLFLGFSLAVFSIILTQEPHHPVSPLVPVLALLLPLFDTLRVMTVRMLRGRNPFTADKSHLHHLLVRRGMSSFAAVILLWTICAVCGTAALLLERHGPAVLIASVLSAAAGLSLLAEVLVLRLRRSWPRHFRTPAIPERRVRLAGPREGFR